MPLIDKKSEKQKLMDKAYNEMWIEIIVTCVIAFIVFMLISPFRGVIAILLYLVIIGAILRGIFKKRFEAKIDEINRLFKDVPGSKPDNGQK